MTFEYAQTMPETEITGSASTPTYTSARTIRSYAKTSREQKIRAKVIALRAEGLTQREICQSLKTNEHTVRRILCSDWAREQRELALAERHLAVAESKAMPVLEAGQLDQMLSEKIVERVLGKSDSAQSITTNVQVNVSVSDAERERGRELSARLSRGPRQGRIMLGTDGGAKQGE